MRMASMSCLAFERQDAERAFSRAWAKTGKRIAARMAMIAITTRSSIRVKARTFGLITPPCPNSGASTWPRVRIGHIRAWRRLVEPPRPLVLPLVRLAASRLRLEGRAPQTPDEEADDQNGNDSQHRVANPRIDLVLHEDHPLPGKATPSCLSVRS